MSLLGNIRQFRDTVRITEEGSYDFPGGKVSLPAASDLRLTWYYPESDVLKAIDDVYAGDFSYGWDVRVVNADSFECASGLESSRAYAGDAKPPLVLNFANPHTPGGDVKLGATAQEEDLCRRSTLYASLSSKWAQPFYRDNKASDKRMFSHGILVSPYVAVFKDVSGKLMPTPFNVAVMTTPAPYAKGVGVNRDRLQHVVEMRIKGMLCVAALCGYKDLVLGAWGCGVFGNDSRAIAQAFSDAIDLFGPVSPFKTVSFAVLDRSHGQKVYGDFSQVLLS